MGTGRQPATSRCLLTRLWPEESNKTTVLMTGSETLGALKKATAVAKGYKPAPVVGRGKAMPLAKTADDRREQQNRRVEILIE